MKETNQNQFMKTTTYAKKKCLFCGRELEKFMLNDSYPFSTKSNNKCCDICNIVYCIPMRYIINQFFSETSNKNKVLVIHDNPIKSKNAKESKLCDEAYANFVKENDNFSNKHSIIIDKKRRYHLSDFELIEKPNVTSSFIKKTLDCDEFSIVPITFSISPNEKYALIIDTSSKVAIPNNKSQVESEPYIYTKRINYIWKLLNLSSETNLKDVVGNIMITPISNLK